MDMYNIALHSAIAAAETENLDRLLHHPDVDINCKNGKGETPLMASIKKDVGSTMAMSLVRLGCDVNCKDLHGNTPLHRAVSNDLIDVAQELIVQGANINAKNKEKETPLAIAICYLNLEAVCLLLYYKVDVNAVIAFSYSHLMYAVDMEDHRIGKVLLDYCDDISVVNDYGDNAFAIAACEKNPLAIDLLKRDADVNIYNPNSHYYPIDYVIRHGWLELFKLIWPQIDELYVYNQFFIDDILREERFSSSEWLECLHLMLNNPLVVSIALKPDKEESTIGIVFDKCMRACFYNYIAPNDRISFIYDYLSMSAEIVADNLQLLHLLFGLNDEFEAVIYAGDLSYLDYKKQMLLIFNEPFNNTVPFPTEMYYEIGRFTKPKGFASMSAEKKKRYLPWIQKHMSVLQNNVILEELDKIPQFPSLVELSRDQAQNCIVENFNIVKAYQFYDAVKSLNLPQIIKDMILFKQPIY